MYKPVASQNGVDLFGLQSLKKRDVAMVGPADIAIALKENMIATEENIPPLKRCKEKADALRAQNMMVARAFSQPSRAS